MENSARFTEIGTVKIEEDDGNWDDGIRYKISGSHNVPFALHSRNGTLFVSGDLDFETKNYYKFVVVAYDRRKSNQTAAVEISVEVEDQDDNIPYFLVDVVEVQVSQRRNTAGKLFKITWENLIRSF